MPLTVGPADGCRQCLPMEKLAVVKADACGSLDLAGHSPIVADSRWAGSGGSGPFTPTRRNLPSGRSSVGAVRLFAWGHTDKPRSAWRPINCVQNFIADQRRADERDRAHDRLDLLLGQALASPSAQHRGELSDRMFIGRTIAARGGAPAFVDDPEDPRGDLGCRLIGCRFLGRHGIRLGSEIGRHRPPPAAKATEHCHSQEDGSGQAGRHVAVQSASSRLDTATNFPPRRLQSDNPTARILEALALSFPPKFSPPSPIDHPWRARGGAAGDVNPGGKC